MTSSGKTVVIGLNWVGDNILALPTYRALQHRYRTDRQTASCIRDEHRPPARNAVHDSPADKKEQDHRQQPGRQHERQSGGVVVDVQGLDGEGHDEHAVAHQRDALAGPE